MRSRYRPKPVRDVRELWHVVFVGDILGDRAAAFRWWRLFTRGGFKHCFATRAIIEKGRVRYWLNVSAGVYWLDVSPLEIEEVGQNLADVVTEGDMTPRILRWPFAPESRYYHRGLITCVSQIKYLLGLRCPRVMTPVGLYDWMVANGAFPLEDYDDGIKRRRAIEKPEA